MTDILKERILTRYATICLRKERFVMKLPWGLSGTYPVPYVLKMAGSDADPYEVMKKIRGR